MAIILKKNSTYLVAYKIKDGKSINTQIDAFLNKKDALERSEQVEKFEIPLRIDLNMKIKDFMYLYFDMVGKNIWNIRHYQGAYYQLNTYILKIIGNDKLKIVNENYAKNFIEKLKMMRVPNGIHTGEFISLSTVQKVFSYMKTAFEMAKQIHLFDLNPFEIGMIFTQEKAEIDRWTTEIVIKAFETCRKTKLFIFLHLVFGCHLLSKEALGITWDEVFIDDLNYAKNTCYMHITKELERVDIDLAKKSSAQDIIKVFDAVQNKNGNTRLALLTRKHGDCIVHIPRMIAKILRDWKIIQSEFIANKKSQYADNNLVLCLSDGKACEYRVIEKEYAVLRMELGYPTLKLGHLKTFSLERFYDGDTQFETNVREEVYDELLKTGYLDSRSVAYKEIQFTELKRHTQKVELRNVFPEGTNEFDLFSIVQEIKKNPELAQQFARLLEK